MDYNIGLLSDPEELRRLLAQSQVQPEDRSGANMQALLALGAALMGAKRGQEFDALSRGSLGALAARNNALEQSREARSRGLVNAGVAQELLSRGKRLQWDEQDRARAAQEMADFQKRFGGGPSPDLSPLQYTNGPTLAAATAQQNPQGTAAGSANWYRQMGDWYAAKKNVDQAKKMYDIADSMEEEFSTSPVTAKKNGKLVYAQFGKKGGVRIADAVDFAEKQHFVNAGDKVGIGLGEYSGTQNTPGITYVPNAAERDASARGWSAQALDKKKFEWDQQKDLAGLQASADTRNLALRKYQDEAGEKALALKSKRENADSTADIALAAADDAMSRVSWLNSGMTGWALSQWKGSDSYNLRAAVETVKANIGWQTLAQMREESKTGGALGNVSEMEIRALQASVANLDPNQSDDVLLKNLKTVKTHLENIKAKRGQAAYVRDLADSLTGSGR